MTPVRACEVDGLKLTRAALVSEEQFAYSAYAYGTRTEAGSVLSVRDAVKKIPQKPTQTSSPGLGSFPFGSQTDVVHSEHEIERYLKEPIENPRQDPVAFHKTREMTFPIISSIARDYFAAYFMSAPAETLISRMGDIIFKKRNNLSPTTIRMLAILKSRGIIREDEIPQDNADTGDDVDQPIELTDEQEDGEVEDWLVVDNAEDDEVTVDTSTATQVFKSYICKFSEFSALYRHLFTKI